MGYPTPLPFLPTPPSPELFAPFIVSPVFVRKQTFSRCDFVALLRSPPLFVPARGETAREVEVEEGRQGGGSF